LREEEKRDLKQTADEADEESKKTGTAAAVAADFECAGADSASVVAAAGAAVAADFESAGADSASVVAAAGAAVDDDESAGAAAVAAAVEVDKETAEEGTDIDSKFAFVVDAAADVVDLSDSTSTAAAAVVVVVVAAAIVAVAVAGLRNLSRTEG